MRDRLTEVRQTPSNGRVCFFGRVRFQTDHTATRPGSKARTLAYQVFLVMSA